MKPWGLQLAKHATDHINVCQHDDSYPQSVERWRVTSLFAERVHALCTLVIQPQKISFRRVVSELPLVSRQVARMSRQCWASARSCSARSLEKST